MKEPIQDVRPTEPSAAEPPWLEPPGAGRALGIGVLIGVIVAFAGATALLLAAGQGLAAAVGLGAFVAIWGGLGFGGMVGGVVWASRLESDARAPVPSRSTIDEPGEPA